MIFFCPEAVPVSHGLGLENKVRCGKVVLFALLLNQGFVVFCVELLHGKYGVLVAGECPGSTCKGDFQIGLFAPYPRG